MTIHSINLYRVQLPLPKPYKVAFKTYLTFDPYIIQVRDTDGRIGWGEAHIPDGYSKKETPDVGWNFCREFSQKIIGLAAQKAKDAIRAQSNRSPMAATALVSAIEMLEHNAVFTIEKDARVPLLAGISSKTLDEIPDEVDALIEKGFKTIKVKVGFEVDDDLARLEKTRAAAVGRAMVRLDANRNYSREDALLFVKSVNPEGLELFEQPCDSDDWDSNAAVAAVSPVPIMLDESIYGVEDVERAGTIQGVDFCKIKLKRAGGIENLMAAMTRCKELGMGPVVGDGVATEIGNWMEACCANLTTNLAGEGNGFLKSSVGLFTEPLPFEHGDIILRKGYWPEIDRTVLQAHSLGSEEFSETQTMVSHAAQ